MRRRTVGSFRGIAPKPMIARLGGVEQAGHALGAHVRPADPRRDEARARGLERSEQRAAEPVARLLGGDQEEC
jgi:hypothetical protein